MGWIRTISIIAREQFQKLSEKSLEGIDLCIMFGELFVKLQNDQDFELMEPFMDSMSLCAMFFLSFGSLAQLYLWCMFVFAIWMP